jgi:hypothetical protein
MQAKLTTKPEQEVLSAIQALDLETVKIRLMDPDVGEGWTTAYADSVEVAYKTYLAMLVKHQDRAEEILPSKDVDEFWHTHILQTIKYADDCQAVFGAFLHHNPHIGKLTQADLDKRAGHADVTRQIYQREFGIAGADMAWAGGVIHEGNAAVSTVAIKAETAAVSTVAIRSDNAAVSTVAIRSGNAAVSTVAIRAENAAVSTVAIRAENAAVSTVAIRAENAAVSTVAARR